MKERIRSLVSVLERDQTNEEAIFGLEELVTDDSIDIPRAEILEEIREGRKKLENLGNFEAVLKIVDLEMALVSDKDAEIELLRYQARIGEEELYDPKVAIDKYQQLKALLPDDEDIAQKIESLEAEREKWREMVDTFMDQAKESSDPQLKAQLLFSAAECTYKNHRRGKEVPALLFDALELDPSHIKAAGLLEKVLKERERWDRLTELYLHLSKNRRDKNERAQILASAAYVYAYRMNNKESAAATYSDVLDLLPGHETALRFLVKYYEEKEDWDHLVAVYEDALRGRISNEDEKAMLMQAGMVHWRMRNDIDAAEEYFKRLRKLDPSHQGVLNFYRVYSEKKGDKSKLIQILGDAAKATEDKDLKSKLSKEVAQAAASKGGNVEKAIDSWRSVLRDDPADLQAKEELKRLYQQSEKWNALLDLLKGEAESLGADDVVRKVKLYEEMADIYREHLRLDTMIINTYKTILELDPVNDAARKTLTEIYEKEGRWNDLINILVSRAGTAEDPVEKVGYLNKVADLWIERFNNFNRAVGPLEEILSMDPGNGKAIETLKGVYQKRRAWPQLVALMEREISVLDGEAKADRLIEMAKLNVDRLSDYTRAIQLWRQVIDLKPNDPEALTSLERLTERQKDWAGLCEVLEMRLAAVENDVESIDLLAKLGTIFKDRLEDPVRAADAWKRVLEIQPGHAKAMRSLREAYLAAENWMALEELYSAVGDYEGLVEVLGAAADRAEDRETKKMLSFRCATIYRDQIQQPDRAVRHYERILSVDPKEERAARALVSIYRRGERGSRLLGVLEIVLEYTHAVHERIAIMNEMREISSLRMNNRALAFNWAARAYAENPSDIELREHLESAAEAAGKYEELLGVFKKSLDKFEGESLVEMERHVAKIAMERLGAVDDAVAIYRAILEKNPADEQTLGTLEEIFRTTARWEDLIGIYERRMTLTEDADARRDLKVQMARLFEEAMDKPEKAAAHYRDVLNIFPEDEEVLVALDRIARSTEKWEDLVDILDRRRSLPGIGDDGWRSLSFQLAESLELKIGEKKKSVSIYKELFDRYPGDEAVISAAEHLLRDDSVRTEVAKIMRPHLVASENWRRLAWTLGILIESTKDPKKRLELYTYLADVYGSKLGDHKLSFETLGAALIEHPDDKAIWDKMTVLAADLGLMTELSERLGEAYRSGKLTDAMEIELASRLAEIIDVKQGRHADAEVYHLRVLAADPSAAGSFNSLENLYTGKERWDDLIDLYKRGLENGVSDQTPLDLQSKICFIVDEVQHDVPRAIDSYLAILNLDPSNTQAIRALTSLYEEAKRWDDLSDLLTSQLDRASSEEAVVLRYRLGEIAEVYLNKPERALDCYEQVLVDDSNHLKAQAALERLLDVAELRQRSARVLERTYDLQGAAEPLVRVLKIELEDERLEAEEKVSIWSRIADLLERRLGDPRGAFDAYSRAFVTDPQNEESRRELSRLSDEHTLHKQYASVLDEAIPKAGGDVALTASLITEMARLYDEKLGDIRKAEAAYHKLLNVDPSNSETTLPAVEALDRILASRESWKELLDVLEVKVKLSDDPKEVLHRMAEIEQSVLGRIPNAIEMFKRILELDEVDAKSLLGLERLYGLEEKWSELIDVLRRRADIEGSADERRDILLRVARLFEENLGNVEEAIAAYSRVVDESGPDRQALSALARLYEAKERWNNLLDVYEAQEPLVQQSSEKAFLLFRMGELLRTKLNEPDRAVARFGEALAIDFNLGEARASLEQMLDSQVKLEAIRILRPIFESEGDYEKLLKYDEIEAEETDDPIGQATVLRRAARAAEDGLEQPQRAFDLLGRAFKVGAASPDLDGLMNDLERLCSKVDGYKTLIELYKEVGPDIVDGRLQVRCYMRAAEIGQVMFDDLDLAREYFVKVLDMDSENIAAMDALEQIYERTEQHLELFEICRKKVQATFDEGGKRTILFKQAKICEEKLSDISCAATTYESILDSDMGNREAMKSLERLYPKLDRWADLMDLLERRVDLDPANRVDLLYRLGTLAKEKLDDDEKSLDYYRRALDADPSHIETLNSLEKAMGDEALKGRVAEILEPVYKARGDWVKLVGSLNAEIEYSDDVGRRKGMLKQIGTLYEEQLGDLDSAFQAFARFFKEDIEDRESWDILSRLASVLDAWGRLAGIYSDALSDVVGDTPVTAELSFILGEIHETRLNNLEEAKRAYRRTLAFSPDDPKAFSAVDRMLLATDAWSELLELYRDAADASLDSERRKEFVFKIAEIQEKSLEDIDAAVVAYKDILSVDDKDQRAIASLDRLYREAGRFEDLAMHIRTQIDNASEPKVRNELRSRLGLIYEESLKDLVSAVDVYEEALREEGGSIAGHVSALERLILDEGQRPRIADILEPLYRETDEWKKLVVILKAQSDYTENPQDKVAKLKEIAKLQETRGGNFHLAFNALAQAFCIEPSGRDTLAEMVRLGDGIGNWDEMTKVLEGSVREIYDMTFRAEVLHIIGSAYDQRLDMPRKAIDIYKEILDIDDADSESLDALEGLYNLVGDWQGLVAVLTKKSGLASSPAKQAELLRNKASIQEDLLSSPEDAIETYCQALDAEPTSTAIMDALDRLYESAGRWNDLIEVKRRRVDVATDIAERLHILQAIARIFEDRLQDSFEAISAWRAVLEEDIKDAAAIEALDRLYTKESMFQELLENLNMQKEMASDQSKWIGICRRIGELQEKELSDLEGAIESYKEVVARQPSHQQTIEALERLAKEESVRSSAIEVLEPLHRQAGSWERLIRVIEMKLEILEDPSSRLSELLVLAELYEVKQSNRAGAFQVYARALNEDPSRMDIMGALERLAGDLRDWDRLAGLYQDLVGKVYDPIVENSLMVRLGEMREEHLNDSRGAIEAYQRAFATGQADSRVLLALDRLYLRESMWPELDEILEREIETAGSVDDENQLRLRQGYLREREFGDLSGAISAFRSVVESSPGNDEAIVALEKLLEKDEFVDVIVEILASVYEARNEKDKIGILFEHRLRVADSVAEKVQLYRDLAAHQEETLGDISAAFDAYSKAFSLDPEEKSVLKELERLAEALGAWAALVDVVDKVLGEKELDPVVAVELGLKVAGWASTKVGDPNKAESLYRSVLEKDPEHQEALGAMESLLRVLGRFEELLPIMKRRAETVYDFAAKKELYKSMAQVARIELGDLERTIEAYRAIRDIDEADLDALDALIELYEEKGEYRTLFEMLTSRASNTLNPVEANRFRHRAASLMLGPIGDLEKAVETYRDILEADSGDVGAGEQLEALFVKLELWSDLRDLYMMRLETAKSDKDRATIQKQLADVEEKHFGALDDAIERLREVILVEPKDSDAEKSIERLYTLTERWQDLIEFFENRIDIARESGDVNSELGFLTKIGEICDERLLDSEKAASFYERVLERDPEHTRALTALARLYEANEDWERCAEVLRKAAATSRGGADEAEVHFRLARLNETHLDDEQGAVEELRKALTMNPEHVEANRALAALCRKRGDYQGLCEALLREETHIEGKADKAAKLMEVAELMRGPLADKQSEVEMIERARILDPKNKDVLLKLSDAYVESGRGNDAIPVIESLIEAETEGGRKQLKPVAVYHHRLYKAYLAKGDHGKALEHLESAYKLDVSNVEVLISLGKLYYDQKAYDKAIKLYRALLLQRFEPSAGASKADIYYYVGDILLKEGDSRKAKSMFQRGLDEDHGHQGCKEGISKC